MHVPKKEGVLGIGSVVVGNKAAMMKYLWDIARKKDSLWVKWCHIYMLRNKSLELCVSYCCFLELEEDS